MGEELVYYHFYHEEASFYMEVCPQLFNRPFIIFEFKLTIMYDYATYLVFYLYTPFC